MKKIKIIYVLLFFIVGFIGQAYSQFSPKDGAKLNYNQIYFEYAFNQNASTYNLYLAVDSTQNKADFKKSLIKIYSDKTPATRVDGLGFGINYKWYVETILNSGEKINSAVHFFSVLGTTYTDSLLYKRKVNYKSSDAKNSGLIWCDLAHCAFDRNGKLVWFMPTENAEYNESTRVRDLKLGNDGTITFIKNPDIIHTTIDLEEIWRAPLTGENVEKFKNGYHHSFQRLPNGNYMALAYDYVELEKTDVNDTITNKVELVNLIEFNKQKEIVWIWEMRDHFPLDILSIPKENGRGIINAHANSFSIDSKREYAYIGFRDISRVIKINMQTKKIEASFGKKLNSADSLVTVTPFFASQHDAKILNDNSIMVINNNDVMANKISSLEIFDQPKSKKENTKRIWNFNFDFDTLNSGKSLKFGNVKILDNGNYLVNIGSGNRIFEITKNKKIVWDMMLFIFDSKKNKWINTGPYKVDYSRSLYPFYFSVGLSQKNTLLIFNEGDYKDIYTVDFIDIKGNILKTIMSKSVTQNKKAEIKVNVNIDLISSINITSQYSKKSKTIKLK